MKKITLLASLTLLAFLGMSFTFSAGVWKHLGSRVVNYKLEKDVIHVGAREGGFKKIKIKVTGGGLHMHRMVVEYGNGQKDKINIKHHFNPGNTTRVIDLKGGKRVIKDITFWYDTRNIARRRGKIHVYARH